MYDELLSSLRICAEGQHCDKCGKWEAKQNGGLNACQESLCTEAADAIEKLSAKVDSLQVFADNISKLPDCNTCMKKTMCEFLPKYGDYCRINCPMWLGEPEQPKGE